ncbi:isocitrate lyase/phosphoenolpyruvate mutase family protein [Kitasatospora sp. NPDC092948]|uniref:isocitrate lyase/PEP mutase family protein n=1 Tax=Kitasatospora sp. NPDC092948 TaxID=3364088 RepID=UPI003806B8F9
MATRSLNAEAQLLRSYHAEGILVLPNAWDGASAALIAAEGAKAIATTSGGISWALGRSDGQRLSRARMLRMVESIVAAVEVPVTADVEGGYGPTGEDVAETVRATLAAGAVGINLEDSGAPDGVLFDVEAQGARIRAARRAAADAAVPEFVINARTDVFLFQVGEPAGRLDEVIGRAKAYAEAGADCLFVPGLVDLAALEALTAASPLPVNAMTGPGGPGVAELSAVGVRRVSVGTATAETAYSAARRAARELLSRGAYPVDADALTYPDVNGLFA